MNRRWILSCLVFVLSGCASAPHFRSPASSTSEAVEMFRRLCVDVPLRTIDSGTLPKREGAVKAEFAVAGTPSNPSNLFCNYENVRVSEVLSLARSPAFANICPHPKIADREGFPKHIANVLGAMQSEVYTEAVGALSLWCIDPAP